MWPGTARAAGLAACALGFGRGLAAALGLGLALAPAAGGWAAPAGRSVAPAAAGSSRAAHSTVAARAAAGTRVMRPLSRARLPRRGDETCPPAAVGRAAGGLRVALQVQRVQRLRQRLAARPQRAGAHAAPARAARSCGATATPSAASRCCTRCLQALPGVLRGGGPTRPSRRRRRWQPPAGRSAAWPGPASSGDSKPSAAQQVELLAARVVHHPLVPAVVDQLPGLRASALPRPG